MILDVESPPKSPASSGPTIRQISGPLSSHAPVSYATFPGPRQGTQYDNNQTGSETSRLLYQPAPQSVYDDTEPPAYDEVNALPKVSASRNRFWARCVVAFLMVLLIGSALYFYDFSKSRRPIQIPSDASERPSPPSATTRSSSVPSPSSPRPSDPLPASPPSTPPLPPLPISDLPDPHDIPFIPPTKGRTDLCRPWAYSSKPGVRPSFSDNRPIDKLVYTVPDLAPIHMKTSAVCLTLDGTSEFCEEYDDTYDSIAGKLQVIGADIELPLIEVTIQHGSETGLDNTAVCLMKNLDEKGKDRWIFGLYAWKDPTTFDRDPLLVSMSIIVTLPKTQVHNFSTHLDYFTQVIGPGTKTDSNTLRFDYLRAQLGQRGSLVVRNVTAAVIQTSAAEDTQFVRDTRVTKSVQIQSYSGVISCDVTLVQAKNLSAIQMDIQSVLGVVSAEATLEYLPEPISPPRYEINVYSRFSPTTLLVQDPRGTNLLRQNPSVAPSALPVLRVNATSHLSVVQALLPATYHGTLDIASENAGVATIDHVEDLPGRIVSYEPTSKGNRGIVQWARRGNKHEEIGSVSIATEYASARLLFLGLKNIDIPKWPESGGEIVLGRLA